MPRAPDRMRELFDCLGGTLVIGLPLIGYWFYGVAGAALGVFFGMALLPILDRFERRMCDGPTESGSPGKEFSPNLGLAAFAWPIAGSFIGNSAYGNAGSVLGWLFCAALVYALNLLAVRQNGAQAGPTLTEKELLGFILLSGPITGMFFGHRVYGLTGGVLGWLFGPPLTYALYLLMARMGARRTRLESPAKELSGVLLLTMPIAGPFLGYEIYGVTGGVLGGFFGAALGYVLAGLMFLQDGPSKDGSAPDRP